MWNSIKRSNVCVIGVSGEGGRGRGGGSKEGKRRNNETKKIRNNGQIFSKYSEKHQFRLLKKSVNTTQS